MKHSTIKSVLNNLEKIRRKNMNKLINMAGAVITAMAICSCAEDTDTIGQSITISDEQFEIEAPKEFPVETRSYVADSVYTQSSTCYLGLVRDPETQTDVKSEFATQFHLLDVIKLPQPSEFVSRENDLPIADSCDILFYLSSPFNAIDSLQSIKMTVHELATTMEPGMKYYSNFNPIKRGMVKPGGLSKNKMFSYRNLTDEEDPENFHIPLNDPYTVGGVTYNNYGTYIIRQYHQHPEYFKNSYAFSHHVCPGFFFEITDGYGFHAKVSNIGLRLFFRQQGDTAVYNSALILSGTREVQQTTLLTNDLNAIKQLAAKSTNTYVKSPAGLFTEATLPVKDIFEGHANDSIIAAKISFQRINDQSDDVRMFGIPNTLLMVQTDSLTNFFESNKVPDQQTTFYANFNYINSTYSGTNTYNFTNIIPLVKYMWQQYQKGIASNPNWEAEHPNWNKVLLVPITYTSGSSTSAEHDMSLSSTQLMKGTKNADSPVKIQVIFAKTNR